MTKHNVPTTEVEFIKFLRNHQSYYDESNLQRLETWFSEAEEMADQCEKASKAARERGDYDTLSDEKIKTAIWRGSSQSLFDEKSILSSYLKWCHKEVKARVPDKRD